MGMVFQAYSLFPNMTALDNVRFGPAAPKAGSAKTTTGPLSTVTTLLVPVRPVAVETGMMPWQLAAPIIHRVPVVAADQVDDRADRHGRRIRPSLRKAPPKRLRPTS